ncbi:SDR family NAD(P)-dependent oxidoreductase [Propionicicella superfundia]|uniref:SDR family NAD(P)-dependent oxidoreductase n=1 Tax=Propionicicella superfundia TaxID=348582 RepID=UPI00042077AD|nr:SDR family NAD(P)-dependent oxidoreductase [Propionicicella superfundia]
MTSTVWLITGSSRGLGRRIVEAALRHGDRVVATARRPETLDDLTTIHPDTLRTIAHDVRDRAQADAAVALALSAFGRLDVVVNNAGYANVEPIETATEESFRDQVETVFFGTVHTTRAALPVLRRQGSGHIVNVSSVGARLATPGLAAYQSAKWATSGFTEVLASEVGPPVRLLLGSDAYAYATAQARARLAADEALVETTRSTDRDDATEQDRNPLGLVPDDARAHDAPRQ